MSDDHGAREYLTGEPADDPVEHDEFANLVLDDNFVRGGKYEPPARTRLAIARDGDRQTSWRHGGGLSARRPADARAHTPGKPRRRPRAASGQSLQPSPALARLPIVVSLVVVGLFAYLMFG